MRGARGVYDIGASIFGKGWEEDYDIDHDKLAEVVAALPTTRLRDVIQRRFVQKQTLQEIGLDWGSTRERVRQFEAKALRYLRHPSRTNVYATRKHGV